MNNINGNPTSTNDIKNFWNDQAEKYKSSALATTPDSIAFNLEIQQLLEHIPSGSKVLDLGCGNGVKGIALASKIDFDYKGIDYSENMINEAKKLATEQKNILKGRTTFRHADMLDGQAIGQHVCDIVMSVRALINLGNFANQVLAVKNAYHALKPSGHYLMIENSIDALNNINAVRSTFGLPEIKERWHNSYINEKDFFSAIAAYFTLERTVPFASTYFLISRTLNALLTPLNKEIDYCSKLNELAAKLPPLGDYAPAKLFILKKIN